MIIRRIIIWFNSIQFDSTLVASHLPFSLLFIAHTIPRLSSRPSSILTMTLVRGKDIGAFLEQKQKQMQLQLQLQFYFIFIFIIILFYFISFNLI